VALHGGFKYRRLKVNLGTIVRFTPLPFHPVPNEQEAGWDSDQVCSLRRRENSLAIVGIGIPDRPGRTVVTIPTEPSRHHSIFRRIQIAVSTATQFIVAF